MHFDTSYIVVYSNINDSFKWLGSVIQKWCIKLIKSDIKEMYNVVKALNSIIIF